MPKNVLAVIPARGGSKGLPGKNVRLFAGKPLIVHSISAAAAVHPPLRKVLVSTDDPVIAGIARDSGAAVPFTRPAELAADEASSLDVVRHAVNWLHSAEGWRPDWVLLLQPTSPLRTPADIEAALAIADRKPCDSVAAVTERTHCHPSRARRITEDALLPFLPDIAPVDRRQNLEPTYFINGALYLTRIDVLDGGSLYGEVCRPHIMPSERSVDIDTTSDFELAEYYMKQNSRC